MRIVPGKTVLDLGCNTGYGTAILSEHADTAVGVDVSERAITLANTKYRVAGVDFRVTEGIRIPFEDNAFDVVTGFQIIEHLVEYDPFMSEVKRVLAPGGIAIFTTPNALLRLDRGMQPWNKFHVREFNPDELLQVLEEHFAHVRLLALYGSDPVHTIEVNRVDRARRGARARASAVPVRRTLPTRAKARFQSWVSARTRVSEASTEDVTQPLQSARAKLPPRGFLLSEKRSGPTPLTSWRFVRKPGWGPIWNLPIGEPS